ncbi:MAG TPA: amidohydrolase family protein [Burkholderiales bacterium]|nr:amidohydrolase family protein [Burkholderiales bacterium]
MIIDFRVRPPIASFRRLSIYTNTQLKGLFDFHGGTPASAREQSLPMMFREMQQAGVVKAVVWGRTVDDPAESSSNDDVANIVADHPDVFVAGLAGICLRGSGQKVVADAVAEVDRALTQLKLRGITIEPMFGMKPAGSPDQERLYPIYERCEQLGGLLGLTISRGSGPDQDLSHCDPVHVDRIARTFPKLRIVVSHAFWPWTIESCGLAFRREHVYLLPDMYGVAMPGHTAWVELANTVSPDKVLFGSAYPIIGIPELVRGYLALPYRNEQIREMVLYRNAARLLGIAD